MPKGKHSTDMARRRIGGKAGARGRCRRYGLRPVCFCSIPSVSRRAALAAGLSRRSGECRAGIDRVLMSSDFEIRSVACRGLRRELSFDFFDPLEVGAEDSSPEGVEEPELTPPMRKLRFAALGFVEDG